MPDSHTLAFVFFILHHFTGGISMHPELTKTP